MIGLAETLRATERQLAAAGIESARIESRILVAHATGIARERLIGAAEGSLVPQDAAKIAELAQRRATREPMALITGRREFWSLDFRVSPATLIPRPDSETLIEAALEYCTDRSHAYRVLDLGTGSGCLLLALLSELPNALGVGVDASEAALRIAAANARDLGLSERAAFVAADWGAPFAVSFDIVLANPPYIAAADWAALEDDVRLFEPATALLAGADGLDAYRALAPHLARLLAPGGVFVGEIGAGQADAAAGVLRTSGLDLAGTRRDLSGIERCLLATRAENAFSPKLNV